jgi:hypothetical protein
MELSDHRSSGSGLMNSSCSQSQAEPKPGVLEESCISESIESEVSSALLLSLVVPLSISRDSHMVQSRLHRLDGVVVRHLFGQPIEQLTTPHFFCEQDLLRRERKRQRQ